MNKLFSETIRFILNQEYGQSNELLEYIKHCLINYVNCHFCLVVPEVTFTRKSQIVLEHDNATLQCFVSGIPQPNVTWSRGSTVLKTSGVVTDSSITNVSLSLILVNVTNRLEGKFTCSGSNIAGTESDSTELIVDGL